MIEINEYYFYRKRKCYEMRQQRSADLNFTIGCKCALLWTADWSLKTNVLYFVNVTTEGNRGEREPASLVSAEFTAS